MWRDDLGHPVELDGPVRRVVSLVPSLTEAVAVSAPGRLVGATDWCTHPAGLAVTRVRGTKNPERARIAALAPDLVIANREVWRDPWMLVGARTFTGDVLTRLGLVNVFGAGPGRYPRVEVGDIRAAAPEVVLLPDEPYPFTAEDGPEEFPAQRVVLVSGRLLTWYGPSLATARADLLGVIG